MSIQVGTPSQLNINSEAVANFYKNQWQRPIALGHIKFYTWQFINVPHQALVDHCCIAIENQQIIGVMGVNKRPFIMDNKTIIGGELTTWIVKPEYRGKGIGQLIISFLQSKYDILYGMGISSDALPVYLRTGFRYLKSIPRFIKVLDWNSIEQHATYSPLAKKVDAYWKKNQQVLKYIIQPVSEALSNQITTNFYASHNMYSRDIEYLTWRYINHPCFEYDVKVIFSDNAGYGVFVCTRAEITSAGFTILHILDIFGDEKDMEAAISYVIDLATSRSIPIIDFFSTSSKINSFFMKNGWFSTLDDECFKFPHLFQPLEFRSPPTTSLIYWAKECSFNAYNLGKLYLTKQDADFDRPLFENL